MALKNNMERSAKEVLAVSKIRTLSDVVANQIAAGEVVERPASAIKELIENSLDAEATSISVSFRDGGKSFVEVSDNGCGMVKDDVLLCIERHATSKITDVNDLRAVKTLGFRGEALSSIASVSRLRLSTALRGASHGVEMIVEGGKLKDVKSASPVPGTSVVVRDLFFNTPVRRKFLRSESVESAHLKEAVTREALSRPDVGFSLTKDGRNIFDARAETSGSPLLKRIETLFGKETRSSLTEVGHEFAGMKIEGYISRPVVTRGTRDMQYVYVNGRYVRDKIINYAINEGFRSLMPKGRFPLLFLRLSMPPERVDVNVSPTKTEVRFVDGSSVRSLVIGGILKTLEAGTKEGETLDSFPASGIPVRPSYSEPAVGSLAEWKDVVLRSDERGADPQARFTASDDFYSPYKKEEEEPAHFSHFDASISENFHAVGQAFKSFILLEDGEKLLLLDQHTAHERVLYEKFSIKYREGKVDCQVLLFPEEIELGGKEGEFLAHYIEDFKRLGYHMEIFGESSFTLRAVPSLLKDKDHKSVVRDILEQVSSTQSSVSFDAVAEDAINIMACRGAVKAGQILNNEEIAGLVSQLKNCKLPYTCPHGRPVSMVIEKNDLLKGFLRK